MTNKDREKLIGDILKKCYKIRQTKGVDYCLGSEDVNKNFKSIGERLNLSPEKVLMVYALKHIDSIVSFLKNGQLKGEPVREKIIDSVNYILILWTLLNEK